ncbi:MAG: hypothetical protein ACFB2W_08315 [Leptolyngbyaceae cyanobacterium]
MFTIYRSHPVGTKRRRFLCLSTLVGLLLASGCVPREECALLNGALAEGNLRIQEINEGNLSNSGYNQGIERQVGRIYFDVSQILDGLVLSNNRLQPIQFALVEAYQQASDYRYQAADLIANDVDPDNQTKADIRKLQLDSEADVGTAIESLRQRCPLR